jgi:hypothetical protein
MEPIYLFHDQGEGPDTLERFEDLLKNALPETKYIRPYLPHIHPGVSAEDSFARISSKFNFPEKSVIIGVGLGGLIAAKYQENRPDMRVIALASPTNAHGLSLKIKMDNRMAIYSSRDEKIKPYTNWPEFSHQAYEYTPLLFHDVESSRYMLSYLIKMYLVGGDVEKEINGTHS